MDNALVLDELDIPTSARWAAADTGLDGLRRQLGGAMARPPTFAADLWETGSRWRSDLDTWREVCAIGGAAVGGRDADLGAIAEEAGRAAACVPVAGSGLVGWALEGRAPAEADIVRLRSGAPGALLWDGPEESVSLRIDRAGRVSGSVAFVVDGAAAQIMVAVALDPDSGPVVCRIDAPDRVVRERRAVADPTRDLATLVLDGVPATVLATGDTAGALLAGLEAAAAVLLALDAVGSAQAALDLAVSYAAQREQFGRVIGSYQAVAHRCADIVMLVANARSLARAAAWAVCWEDPGVALAAAEAKAGATENAVEAGRRAIQVHGGIGMTWARPTHVHYKRAWVDRAALGSARHQRARIVDALNGAATGRTPMYRTAF